METRIFVISMRESAERRRSFSERAKGTRVSWEFFDACTELAADLAYDEADALLCWGRHLRAAELGCYASHYSLWRQLIDDRADQYIVLEDDVIVDWPLLETLAEIDFSKSGIEYLRLHCSYPSRMRLLRYHFVSNRNLVELRDYAYGTLGYLITRSAATKLVRHSNRVTRPVDSQMDRYWEHNVPNLSLFPFPVMEESGRSTIGERVGTRPRRPIGIRFKSRLLDVADRVKRWGWRLRRSPRSSEFSLTSSVIQRFDEGGTVT